ncbi:MAG: PD-(D/E)XK nuclease family protein [Methanomassiliicoccales archaeon]
MLNTVPVLSNCYAKLLSKLKKDACLLIFLRYYLKGMPITPHQIEVERIGEYVQRNSCPRRFKLDLDGRKKAKELPFFTRLINPVDPVLQASGSEHEKEWESRLYEAGYTNIITRSGIVGTNISWESFVQSISKLAIKERLFAREVEVSGIIGKFLLRGRMDFVVVDWDGDQPLFKVVECKASRKDRTYHRIQLSIYLALVKQAASAGELIVNGKRLSPDRVQGILVRLSEDGRAEDIPTALPLDLEVEMEDVRRMLDEGGQLHKVCESELEDLTFQIDGKCDSCVMNVYCLPESARTHRLELLGLGAPITRAFIEAGVEDLVSLSNLEPTGKVAELIRRSPTFTGRLDHIIEKARVRLSTLPGGEGFEVAPLSNAGLGLLPEHVIDGRRLVRCYISVNYDYSENRVAALSAHITDSPNRLETRWENRKRLPGVFESVSEGDHGKVRGQDVVLYQPDPGRVITSSTTPRRLS